MDKKKKKAFRNCLVGISDEYMIYLCDEFGVRSMHYFRVHANDEVLCRIFSISGNLANYQDTAKRRVKELPWSSGLISGSLKVKRKTSKDFTEELKRLRQEYVCFMVY
jgi:transcriptional regulator of met regulon